MSSTQRSNALAKTASFRWAPDFAAMQQVLVQRVLPPVVIIALLGILWELLCSSPGAVLPPPSQVLRDTWELIVNPFYNHGGNDVGMAWQILASLERVAYGYSLAVVAG
ncbi:MAG: nitrate ABC transporter permease, partial [Billgrantia desiderata]